MKRVRPDGSTGPTRQQSLAPANATGPVARTFRSLVVSTINCNQGNPQQTVNQPGTYSINISALAVNPKVTFTGAGTYIVSDVSVGVLSTYMIESTAGAAVTVTGLASVATTVNLQVDGTSSITLNSTVSALSTINAAFTATGAGRLVINPSLLGALSTRPTVSGFGADDVLE